MPSDQLLIRLDPALRPRLERAAAKERRSMSNLASKILDDTLPAADDTDEGADTDEEDDRAA